MAFMAIGALRGTETGGLGGPGSIGGAGLGVRCETRTYSIRLDETIQTTGGRRPDAYPGLARFGCYASNGRSGHRGSSVLERNWDEKGAFTSPCVRRPMTELQSAAGRHLPEYERHTSYRRPVHPFMPEHRPLPL